MSSATIVGPGISLQEALDRLQQLVNSSRVEEARSYVKDVIREWPDSERAQHWDRVLAPPRILGWKPASGKSFSVGERAWLKAYAHEYPGCWIALDDDRMIAADQDLDVVRRAVKADGADDPLFHSTPDPARWP